MEALFVIFLALGLFLIALVVFHIPTLAATKAVMDITQPEGKPVFQLNAVIMSLSSMLGRWIKLNDSVKKEWQTTLQVADIPMQPETYFARCAVKAGLKLLALIPFSFLEPMMDLAVIAWVVTGLFSDITEAQKKVKQLHEEINRELPRFVSTVEQQLNASSNILTILEGYKASAGKAFKYELEITIADMKSGSQEQALIRLESRVNTTMMSQTVRGLLAVLRGNNGIVHFSMLSHDFTQQELQQLKMVAIKRPDKLNLVLYVFVAAFFITLLLPIATYLMDTVKGMF